MIITKNIIHRGKKKLVTDLSKSSTHKIKVQCPECNEIRLTILRVIKRRNNYRCHQCTLKDNRKPIPLNKRFGRLFVKRESTRHGYSICQCDCGNILEISNHNLRKGRTNSCGCLRHNNNFPYHLKGKDHPNWKGGISKHRSRYMQAKVYKTWRKAIYERDLYTCQKCKQIGYELRAHHIESYAEHENKRCDIDNGITLCHKCHLEFHKIYGRNNINKKQLDTFLLI